MLKFFSIIALVVFIGFFIAMILWMILPRDWLIKEYPKEWEEEEDREIERKFKEYEESQED